MADSAMCEGSLDYEIGPVVSTCLRHFDLTALFEEAILIIIPCSLFLLAAATRLYCLAHRKTCCKGTYTRYVKMIVYVILGALRIALAIQWSLSSNSTLREVTTIPAAVLSIVSVVILAFLAFVEDTRSIRSSTIVLLFLLFNTTCEGIRTRTVWLRRADGHLAAVLTAATVVQFLLFAAECFKVIVLYDDADITLSPEEAGGIFNRTFFWWLKDLFVLGQRTELQQSDLYLIPSDMVSRQLCARFASKKSKTKAASSNALTTTLNNIPNASIEPGRSLLSQTFTTLWYSFLIPAPGALIAVFLRLAQPLLMIRILNYLDDGAVSKNHFGIALILAYAGVYIALAFCESWSQYLTYRAICQIRGLLVSQIYERTLRLDPTDQKADSAITLMSIDIQRIADGGRNFHEAWSALLQVILALYLLERQVGVAFTAPLILIAVAALVAGAFGSQAGGKQQRWLKAIEVRIGFTSQVLGNLKGAKIAGLADFVHDRLINLRSAELKAANGFRQIVIWSAAMGFTPNMYAPLLCFGWYIARHGATSFTAVKIFPVISLIYLITQPLIVAAQEIPSLVSVFGCFNRIQTFLEEVDVAPPIPEVDELPEKAATVLTTVEEKDSVNTSSRGSENGSSIFAPSKFAVTFSGVSFKSADADFKMEKLSLRIPHGQCVAVTGPPGSGKSLLCKMVIGEVRSTEGSVVADKHSVAYCGQTPWLRNDTIRENILAGGEFDSAYYSRVLECCVLKDDILKMPQRDETMVGSNGFALSGGQKQRVCIARALYARRSLIVLDGVFSGLDNSTNNSILSSLLGKDGLLRGGNTTVFMATNTATSLRFADNCYVLDGSGNVCEEGAWENLTSHVANLITTAHPENPESVPVAKQDVPNLQPVSTSAESNPATYAKMNDEGAVYKYFASTVGRSHVIAFVLLQVCWAAVSRFCDVWLGWWTDAQGLHVAYYIGIYAMLQIMSFVVLIVLASHLLLFVQVKAGRNLHRKLVDTVLNASLFFLSQTDTGDMLNRFSQDLQIIDSDLPFALMLTVATTVTLLAQCILLIPANHWVALSYPPLAVMLYILQRVYLKVSKRLRLLDLEAKNPLYVLFNETLQGLSTIRAFGWQQQFMQDAYGKLDESQKPFYLLYCVQIWLNLVLNLMVAGVTLTFLILIVALGTKLPTAFTGIALYSIVGLGQSMQSTIVLWTTTETSMGAISRIKTFEETTPKETDTKRPVALPEEWPHSGEVSVSNLGAEYTNGTPVLKNVSFSIKAGEKVALCGASGSGKSTLQLAFLRLVEFSTGTVTVDEIDLSRVPVRLLRLRCNGNSQDAFLADVTIRENLDPNAVCSSEQIAHALEQVSMQQVVECKGGLDVQISSEMFSFGQRQLLCLARALLRKSKLVLLDEATSSLDEETARTVHRAIHSGFRDCTIIAAIHRLHDVMDYDRVLVLENGEVKEFDTPQNLLGRNSALKKLYELEVGTS